MNWDQLQALVWLRWRLSRNQWSRGGQVSAVISAVFLVMGLCLAVAGGIGGVAAGALALPKAPPMAVLITWDAVAAVFLMLWCGGVVTELQRAEMIDLNRLMHLPISLRDAFLLNYAASHASISLAMVLPLALGLVAGSAMTGSFKSLLLLPGIFGFFFMITAWTAYLRGWLSGLMLNQRRRRTVVMAVTVVFVLIFQLPNLLTSVLDKPGRARRGDPEAAARHRERRDRFVQVFEVAHTALPFLWLPVGARELAQGNPAPAFLGALGTIALGGLGLRRAYRATLRFHQGQVADAGETARRPVAQAERRSAFNLLERELPWVPPETAAVALATFRSMTRAPEVKMALALNVVVFGMLGLGFVARGVGQVPEGARSFVACGVVAVTFLGLLQTLLNQFGFDRDGFRAFVLSPVARWQLLLGKNLAQFPVAFLIFAVVLFLTSMLTGLGPLVVLSCCVLFVAAYLEMCVIGNAVSILMPFRIAPGSMNPTKMSATKGLIMVAITMLLPAALAPLALPALVGLLTRSLGGSFVPWIELAVAAALLGIAMAGYAWALRPTAAWLQRRERDILASVSAQVE